MKFFLCEDIYIVKSMHVDAQFIELTTKVYITEEVC